MLVWPVIEPGPDAPKSGTQPLEPMQPVGSFGGRCLFSSGVWCLPITGGLLPPIGPNDYRFLLMLYVNAFARAPAES